MQDPKVIRDELGKVVEVYLWDNYLNKAILYPFDESEPLVKKLRSWEKENYKLDLNDRIEESLYQDSSSAITLELDAKLEDNVGVDWVAAIDNALATHKSELTAHTPQQVGAESDGAVAEAIAFHATSRNHPTATQSAPGLLSAADKAKLDGIATGATLNAADAQLRDRGNHTGTQPASSITGLGIAQVAGLQAVLSSLQPAIALPSWNNVNLINGWSGLIGYLKSIENFVLLQGLVNKSSKPVSGQIIGVLPVGFRPPYGARSYSSDQSGTNRLFIDINSNGEILYVNYSGAPQTTTNLLISLWFYTGN